VRFRHGVLGTLWDEYVYRRAHAGATRRAGTDAVTNRDNQWTVPAGIPNKFQTFSEIPALQDETRCKEADSRE
jgi:hypothetical protein